MHEDILAAAVPNDEPKPFPGGVELNRAELLDRSLVRRCLWALGPGTPSGLLLGGTGADAQDLGYLLAFLAGPDPTSRVAPGGTVLLPLRSTTLT